MENLETIKRFDVQKTLKRLCTQAVIGEQSLSSLASILQDPWQKEIAIYLWQAQGRQVAELEEHIRLYGGDEDLRAGGVPSSSNRIDDRVNDCLQDQHRINELYLEALNERMPTDILLLLQRHQFRRNEIRTTLHAIKLQTITLQSA